LLKALPAQPIGDVDSHLRRSSQRQRRA
jgi:hypothetical protein